MQLTTNDGFAVDVIDTEDGEFTLQDSEDTLRVYCKITPAYDENNNAVYSLVLTGSYIDGQYHDFINKDKNGVKSCPSKKELDFINDIIDCADCGEFSAVEVEFREAQELDVADGERERRSDYSR
jgi:hypothetical protein